MNKQERIKKQDELIKLLKVPLSKQDYSYYNHLTTLESELSSLKAEAEVRSSEGMGKDFIKFIKSKTIFTYSELDLMEKLYNEYTSHPSPVSKMSDSDIEKCLENLIFTASKLWDEVKNIKDTDIMTVTHPIIEEAKFALKAHRDNLIKKG